MQDRNWQKESAFHSGLRDALRGGKYTRDYADLTGDELAGLLWLLGEYTSRAEPLPVLPTDFEADRRKIIAHNALVNPPRPPLQLTLDFARDLMRCAITGCT